MHGAQDKLERREVFRRQVAVIVVAKPVQFAAHDDLDLGMGRARLIDGGQVLTHSLLGHGQVVPRIERIGQRVMLGHGDGGHTGGRSGRDELFHRSFAMISEAGMRMGGDQFHARYTSASAARERLPAAYGPIISSSPAPSLSR